MIWLILSIVCSTLIFIVFKLFDKYGIDNLQGIVVNYFVAYSVGFFTDRFDFNAAELVEKPWFFSTFVLGALFISLFQLMAMVSQKFGVAAVSVAVKMSLVVPVLFAVFYYGESFGITKILGVVFALAAVYLATRKPSKTKGHISLIFLPIILFLGSGFLDAFITYNQQELVPIAEHGYFTSLLFLVAAVIGVIWFLVQWLRGKSRPRWKSILGGIALGIPNYGSIYFLLKALDYRNLESSVIFPVNNVGIVALSVICGRFLFSEHLSRVNKIGILLAIVSIVLMAIANIF